MTLVDPKHQRCPEVIKLSGEFEINRGRDTFHKIVERFEQLEPKQQERFLEWLNRSEFRDHAEPSSFPLEHLSNRPTESKCCEKIENSWAFRGCI